MIGWSVPLLKERDVTEVAKLCKKGTRDKAQGTRKRQGTRDKAQGARHKGQEGQGTSLPVGRQVTSNKEQVTRASLFG
jgi:hypothetical protein